MGARKRPLSALDARLRAERGCERDKTIGLLCVVFSHDLVSLLNVREPWDYVVKPKDFSGYFKSILGYPILSRTPILVPRPNDFNPCGLRQSGFFFVFCPTGFLIVSTLFFVLFFSVFGFFYGVCFQDYFFGFWKTRWGVGNDWIKGVVIYPFNPFLITLPVYGQTEIGYHYSYKQPSEIFTFLGGSLRLRLFLEGFFLHGEILSDERFNPFMPAFISCYCGIFSFFLINPFGSNAPLFFVWKQEKISMEI